MALRHILPLLIAAVVTGCATPRPAERTATGQLVRTDGVRVGTVRVIDEQAGSRIHIEASGLPPGLHGIHLHSAGRCDGPGFTAAGPHWNPTGRQHGHDNRLGHHAGDLGNIMVAPDGTLATDLIATDVRELARDGSKGLVFSDADGASLIIHAMADDERTDPSGNSGARIACAVIAAPRS